MDIKSDGPSDERGAPHFCAALADELMRTLITRKILSRAAIRRSNRAARRVRTMAGAWRSARMAEKAGAAEAVPAVQPGAQGRRATYADDQGGDAPARTYWAGSAVGDMNDLPCLSASLSLHVVGASQTNSKGGGDRRFEILLCPPGEPAELVPERRNPVDPPAIAVFSARAVRIVYLAAERAPWIGSVVRNGTDIVAIFQQATKTGAVIRIGDDREQPTLPEVRPPDPSVRTRTPSGPTMSRPTTEQADVLVVAHPRVTEARAARVSGGNGVPVARRRAQRATSANPVRQEAPTVTIHLEAAWKERRIGGVTWLRYGFWLSTITRA